ncbi:MAG: class I SAM-dependent methyltransferase [Planctomycetota bacterium]
MEQIAPATPVTLRPNPILKWIRIKFLERTLWRLPKTDKVLDLCCGYGFYFSINPNARAIDGNPLCIEQLKKEGRNARLCNILEPLPFKDGEFEWVVAHDVCEHFTYEQLISIYGEAHRILQPSGTFLVIIPNRKGYDLGLQTGAGHVLFVTATEIESLSRGLFRIEQHYAEPFPRWIGRFFAHNKEVFHLRKI